MSCKPPTVADVAGAGGTARRGRGAGRKWRAHGQGRRPWRARRRDKVRPTACLLDLTREIVRPTRQKTPILGHYEHAGRTISRSHPPPDPAGRTFSRTGRTEVATMQPMTPLRPLIQASVKPPSPMLTPEQHPLKPATPMQAKNAPKTPNSHPQRRCRFQLGLGLYPQRRQRFQPHTGTSKQRQQRLQESGPPGLRDPDAVPVGGDDTTATHISHVIYRGHFSRYPKNVAIPTTHIQCLNEP